eukprot:2155511-Karenia_brevis.AAC.1
MPTSRVSSYCSNSERWRFQFEDSIGARAHALDPSPEGKTKFELLAVFGFWFQLHVCVKSTSAYSF